MLAAWGVTSPWPGGITDDGHVLRDGEAAACAATWLSGAQGGPCWRLGGVPKVAATRLERASWRQVWPAGGVSSDDGKWARRARRRPSSSPLRPGRRHGVARRARRAGCTRVRAAAGPVRRHWRPKHLVSVNRRCAPPRTSRARTRPARRLPVLALHAGPAAPPALPVQRARDGPGATFLSAQRASARPRCRHARAHMIRSCCC